MTLPRAICILITVTCLAVTARAASPDLRNILPRGGQRGTELDVTFTGARLGDIEEVIFYDTGIAATRLAAATQPAKGGDATANERNVKFHLRIAPDAPLGEHAMRVRGRSGISDLRTFWVGALPVVADKEPNNTLDKPQPIAMNVTVAGVIDNEDTDCFSVDLKRGQRLTAEVEAMRLGGPLFDPALAIYGPDQKKLAAADDTALLKQDCFVSILAPRDGIYVIQLKEATLGGSGDSYYRLHVGTFPRPTAVYPAGGKPGESLSVKFLGDVGGPIAQSIQLPRAPDAKFEVFAQHSGQIAPSPNYMRVNELANVNEVEPNNDVKTATGATTTQPAAVTGAGLAFNGIINEPKDVDFFRFAAKKDQPLEVNVWARRLRSPLDPVLTIYNAQGKQLASNDDAGTPDSYLRFAPPADGEYILSVRDQMGAGGVDYVYRVELTPAVETLVLSVPPTQQNNATQERQAMAVPRGGRFATLIRAVRGGVNGELSLEFKNLPSGVKVDATSIAQGQDMAAVVFEADPSAPLAAKLADVNASRGDGKPIGDARFNQTAELVPGQNNTYYHQVSVDKLAVSVDEPAPFSIEVVEPKVPLVQSGAMNVKVIAKRQPGFTGPIQLRMLYLPNGVSTQGQVDIAPDKTEAEFPLNAGSQAPSKKFRTAVLASSDVKGPLWVSSKLFEMEVAPPMVVGKMSMTSVEQGQTVKIDCSLDAKQPWDGKAKVELLGLPPNVTCDPQEATANDKKVTFTLVTTSKTPPGVQNGLFCRVSITQDGEVIQNNIARGAVLRVDLPAPAKKNKAATTKPTQTAAR